MKKSFLLLLFSIAFSFLSFAQQTIVKGSVLDGTTGEPIPDVTITIEETGQTLKTDAKGEFSFNQNVPLGEQVLKIEKVGYVTKRYPIIVNEGATVDISGMTLDFDTSDKKDLFIISISDDNLNGEDDGLTDNVSGLLQASRDVFLSAAAFDFSAAFFRPRGLDNANGKVLINGVEMNKQFNGRPQWGNWGGLNDVQRNQEFTMGTAANDYTFGDLAGTNNIMMRASKYRRGGRISYASANRSYQGRVMASYSSGLLEGGWSYSVLGSRRFGEEGFIDGTLYDANSLFVAVEKQLNDKHSLNFTGIYAQNRRGRSTAITQEIFNLKGRRYNPFWGIQNGEQRNSRIREIEEPILMLNHYWDISSKVKLNTNVAYQFGEVGNTRVDFFGSRADEDGNLFGGARNPTPEYWQRLPSFFLATPNPTPNDFSNAFLAQGEFVNNGQLDWNQFYEANALNGYNIFALQSNVNRDQQLTFNSIIDAELSDNIRLNGNVNYRTLNSENFARIEDLFGGPGYLDVNIPFQDGEGFGQSIDIFAQSNIRTPNRIVQEGDKYSYHYDINADVLSSFVQAQFKYNKVDFYVGANISNTSYQREGFYENGYFPDDSPIINSFGESEKVDFTNFGLKAGATYKVTGKHLIDVNASYFTKAPGIRQSFANARQNNLLVTDLESETIQSVDASYIFRSPILKARLTGYFTEFTDGTEVNFFFTETGGNLVQEIVQNIDRRNFGGELGIEAQVTPTIKLKGAAAMGQFTYTNNPDIYLSSDRYADLSFGDGTTEVKDLRVASGPERVFQVGFEYRDPDFWNFGVTTNFFSHTYVDPSFLKRSGQFAQDPDAYDLDAILNPQSPNFNPQGVYNISGFGVADYDEEIARNILRQERFDDYMLVNLTGGKSWKIKDYFVGFFATINNVFNQDYRTGGFEQARRIDYLSQVEELTNSGGPIFGNRYFFGNGTTYYLNVYVRF